MNALELTRWILATLFGVFWLIGAVGNLGCIISAARRHGSTSLVLFFAGIAGIVSVLLCPIPGFWIWFWVPPLLDIGTFPALAAMIYGTLTKRPSEPKSK